MKQSRQVLAFCRFGFRNYADASLQTGHLAQRPNENRITPGFRK